MVGAMESINQYVYQTLVGVLTQHSGMNITERESRDLACAGIGRDLAGIDSGRDLAGAASSGYGYDCCPPVVDPYTWLALISGIALAAYFLRQAILTNVMAGRSFSMFSRGDVFQVLLGLEEFEEKIEKMEEKEEKEEGEKGGWLSSIVQGILQAKKETEADFKDEDIDANEDVDEDEGPEHLDDLEPLLLDPLWDKDHEKLKTIVDEEWKHSNKVKRSIKSSKSKREKEEPASCKIKIWRCLSGVMETGVKYIEKPGGITGFAQKAFFKMAFHGGFSNVWSSLMTIPEARRVAKCLREHDDCITKEILSKDLKTGDTRRVLVNPEYVEGLDTSDGSEQYDYTADELNSVQ